MGPILILPTQRVPVVDTTAARPHVRIRLVLGLARHVACRGRHGTWAAKVSSCRIRLVAACASRAPSKPHKGILLAGLSDMCILRGHDRWGAGKCLVGTDRSCVTLIVLLSAWCGSPWGGSSCRRGSYRCRSCPTHSAADLPASSRKWRSAWPRRPSPCSC